MHVCMYVNDLITSFGVCNIKYSKNSIMLYNFITGLNLLFYIPKSCIFYLQCPFLWTASSLYSYFLFNIYLFMHVCMYPCTVHVCVLGLCVCAHAGLRTHLHVSGGVYATRGQHW